MRVSEKPGAVGVAGEACEAIRDHDRCRECECDPHPLRPPQERCDERRSRRDDERRLHEQRRRDRESEEERSLSGHGGEDEDQQQRLDEVMIDVTSPRDLDEVRRKGERETESVAVAALGHRTLPAEGAATPSNKQPEENRRQQIHSAENEQDGARKRVVERWPRRERTALSAIGIELQDRGMSDALEVIRVVVRRHRTAPAQCDADHNDHE